MITVKKSSWGRKTFLAPKGERAPKRGRNYSHTDSVDGTLKYLSYFRTSKFSDKKMVKKYNK